jgi:hypothetical protein
MKNLYVCIPVEKYKNTVENFSKLSNPSPNLPYDNNKIYRLGDIVTKDRQTYKMIDEIGAAGYPPPRPTNWQLMTSIDYLIEYPHLIKDLRIDDIRTREPTLPPAPFSNGGIKIDKDPPIVDDKLIYDREPIGGQRDSHGCLTPAGYGWCPTLKECVQSWITPCPDTPPSESSTQKNEQKNIQKTESIESNINYIYIGIAVVLIIVAIIYIMNTESNSENNI